MLRTPSSLLLLFLLTSILATAQAPECVPGKLSDYEKLGPEGCRIGDIQFSGFTRGKASNGLLSKAISVTPGTAIDSTDPALLLEGPWVAKPQPTSVVIAYKVTAVPPAKPVIAASIQMQFGEITGTGTASIDAAVTPATTSEGTSARGHRLRLALGKDIARKDSDEADLSAPGTEIRVTESITMAGGRNGSAKINGFMTVFQLQGVKSGTN